MSSRAPYTLGRALLPALLAAVLAAASGCGNRNERADDDAKASAHRARQVADAWQGSTAAAAWRAGYHPMGDVVQLPEGGLRGASDRQAYAAHSFVLRAKLPTTSPAQGQVVWSAKERLARPLQGADASYRALAGDRDGRAPHLTVTAVERGEMTVATSRGPAVVPAWLYTLDGYDSPLRRAAAVPSPLPRPPIAEARDVPGHALRNLVRTGRDGRSATVNSLHGTCDAGPVVAVLETDDSVVLSGSVSSPEHRRACTKQGRIQQVTVRLRRPLDDRVLLDGHTGRPVPYQPPNGPSPSWS
ncbi:hypothetical protein ACFYVL_31335 [Streptomyces sp. NPDC004111]|uniref:hypothetical protein n=1 Tax=Streptomyces sp. NPDC004111 TaxID=3364690 RepID=UPI00367A215A